MNDKMSLKRFMYYWNKMSIIHKLIIIGQTILLAILMMCVIVLIYSCLGLFFYLQFYLTCKYPVVILIPLGGLALFGSFDFLMKKWHSKDIEYEIMQLLNKNTEDKK